MSTARPAPEGSSPGGPAPAVDVGAAPDVSIVIPVYNEERILAASLAELRERLREFPWSYEILVS